MKYLLTVGILGLGLFSSGCSWFKSASVQAVITSAKVSACAAESSAVDSLTKKIADTLQCSAPDQIKASIMTALGNANVCKYLPVVSGAFKPQGMLANVFCPVASSAVMGFLTAQIPQAWGCVANAEAAAMQLALVQVCETIPY